METETLDRLYLEWSQFTKARTQRELEMEETIALLDSMVRNCESHTDQTEQKIREVLGQSDARPVHGVSAALLTGLGRIGFSTRAFPVSVPFKPDPEIKNKPDVTLRVVFRLELTEDHAELEWVNEDGTIANVSGATLTIQYIENVAQLIIAAPLRDSFLESIITRSIRRVRPTFRRT